MSLRMTTIAGGIAVTVLGVAGATGGAQARPSVGTAFRPENAPVVVFVEVLTGSGGGLEAMAPTRLRTALGRA